MALVFSIFVLLFKTNMKSDMAMTNTAYKSKILIASFWYRQVSLRKYINMIDWVEVKMHMTFKIGLLYVLL